MILLKKTEQLDIFQVELVLKEKTRQSPFIAVLILAQEQGKITAESLQENLLPTIPISACNNLLLRLKQQEYLEDYYNETTYKLTGFGEQSAIDKSFWVGEKGIYNLYVTHSNLINQQIIKTEKVDRSEDDRNGNRIIRTPHFLSQYQNQILNINKKEILIEEIENSCFQLKPLDCSLEIETKDYEGFIRIKEQQTLYQSAFERNEKELKVELLKNTNEVEYDENKEVILFEFNQNNLSFQRKLKLQNPFYQGNQFSSVEMENVAFIPVNKQNAEWLLNEILFKGIENYFIDENSFTEFVVNKAKPILTYYDLELPTRKQLKNIIAEKENSFYQTAKIETIDYLNY